MHKSSTILATIGSITLLVSGCAAIFEGTDQQIYVSTSPQGAKCRFEREDRIVGMIESTPGEVTVERTKDDLMIICSKPGYEDAQYVNRSGANIDGTGASIILSGGVGWLIDSATGADNEYTSSINLNLARIGPTTMQAVPSTDAEQGTAGAQVP